MNGWGNDPWQHSVVDCWDTGRPARGRTLLCLLPVDGAAGAVILGAGPRSGQGLSRMPGNNSAPARCGGAAWGQGAARPGRVSAREIARALAHTSGASSCAERLPCRTTSDTAAATSPPGPYTGAATDKASIVT